MGQSRFDYTALLLLNEFVESLANRHCRHCLLRFPALRLAYDVRRQIARQNQIVLAQSAGAFDRILQLAHIARIIVVTQNLDRLRIDFLWFTTSRTRLLL